MSRARWRVDCESPAFLTYKQGEAIRMKRTFGLVRNVYEIIALKRKQVLWQNLSRVSQTFIFVKDHCREVSNFW